MENVQKKRKFLTEAEKLLAEEEEMLGLEKAAVAAAASAVVGGGDDDASKQIALLPGTILEEAEAEINLLHLQNAFDVDDEEVGGTAKPASSAGGRHSESKKEMLKVIENSINRLMKERAELDKISRQLAAGEEKAEKELELYVDMLKYAKNLGTGGMNAKEWEEFFNLYFVQGGEPVAELNPPKIKVVKKEEPRDVEDEGKNSDMEMD